MSRRVKVMYIITKLGIGGSSYYTLALSSKINPDRYETVLVKGFEKEDEGDMMRFFNSSQVRLILVPVLCREIHPVKDLLAFVQLWRIIKAYRPDIIHTNSTKAGVLGRLAGRMIGVPVIIHTIHGHVFHSYFNPVISYLFRLIERFSALCSHKVITVGELQRRDILQYKVGNSRKVISIPIGLELEPLLTCERYRGQLKRELGLDENILVVGIVARLFPVKGHDLFLEAAAKVQKEFSPVKFIIVGGGELEEPLKHKVKKLQMERDVFFLGYRGDLPEIYADLDVVVLSSYNEGLPVSIIEAMAAAKPVVATEVGGVRELVQHEETGYVVPPGNANALAEAILKLIKDPSKRHVMGTQGRQHVNSQFTLERMLQAMDCLYLQMLEEKRNSQN